MTVFSVTGTITTQTPTLTVLRGTVSGVSIDSGNLSFTLSGTGSGDDGDYSFPAGPAQGGEQEYFVPSTVTGTGTYSRDTQGIWAQFTGFEDAFTRIGLEVVNPNPLQDDAVFFRVTGLTDFERTYFGFKHDFGDSGTFEHLRASNPFGRDMNVEYGYQTAHCYGTSGAKTYSLLVTRVLDDGTADTKTLTATINVRSLDFVFGSANTWIVGSNGSDSPPSGNTAASLDTALMSVRDNGGGRILIKGGTTQDLSAFDEIRATNPSSAEIYIGAWGTGKPTIDTNAGGGLSGVSDIPDRAVIKDIVFTGDYDPATGLDGDLSAEAVRYDAQSRLCLNGCEFSGVQSGVVLFGVNADVDSAVMVFDCKFGSWENYGIYSDSTGHFCLRGSVVEQSPLAVNGAEEKILTQGERNYPDHASSRNSRPRGITIYASNEFFTANGWSFGNDPGAPTGKVALTSHQPCIRHGSFDVRGSDLIVIRNWIEGSGANLSGSATGGLEGAAFQLVTGNYLLATANTTSLITYGHSRIYDVRNVYVIPNVLAEQASVRAPVGVGIDSPVPGWIDYGWHRAFNTVLYLPSDANIRGAFLSANVLEPNTQGLTLTDVHNVFHMPNATFDDEGGPRDVGVGAATIAMTPRYLGQRRANIDNSAATTDTTYATSASDVLEGKLDAAASSLDGTVSASVSRPAYDVFGVVCTGSTHPGAHHVTV